ncbi:N-formylglutamate amidohydrolase [Desulfovibrio sulfodismutans]|uniref:N-formylglutamate amidohydrolase n=1 Tax=Desulfolutivibrio sulfodismutans TaxID=63561 RepID=A0A7K3NRD5_9BACT|nr:N-formylglutamate amidohydrolase [Desulfolutivibrio sulfodismutans]NDY58687.1 N-formylglutamate amidohydrolase [Desulfolutivibrio sulfodismutans]QLA11637.1 N-formylglutamate amidohydrolase [Desulfolutivibrio sulfodismutans DSM 3696]
MADAQAARANTGQSAGTTGKGHGGPSGGLPDGLRGHAAAVVVTCEHGGNRVPPEVACLFTTTGDHLAGHGGYDAGALEMARAFAAAFAAPLFFTTVTRLVVDQNRSLSHPKHFSKYTKGLPEAERQALLDAHYHPMRRETREAVSSAIARGRTVVHLASHSFVPVLHGVSRTMDIGLLYDPSREGERALCAAWKDRLKARRPWLRVRRNAPYKGVSDGHVTALRRLFPAGYLGIELEVNQRFVAEDRPAFDDLLLVVPDTFAEALADIGLVCGDTPPPSS